MFPTCAIVVMKRRNKRGEGLIMRCLRIVFALVLFASGFVAAITLYVSIYMVMAYEDIPDSLSRQKGDDTIFHVLSVRQIAHEDKLRNHVIEDAIFMLGRFDDASDDHSIAELRRVNGRLGEASNRGNSFIAENFISDRIYGYKDKGRVGYSHLGNSGWVDDLIGEVVNETKEIQR